MDQELKEMLNMILANQAVLFKRIQEIHNSTVPNSSVNKKAFYDDNEAAKELKIISDKLLKDSRK